MNKKFATHAREPFFALAAPFITPTSKVLDIGPGRGDFSDHHGRTDFYLFEGNPETVVLLKQKHANVSEGLLPTLPFADGFFDMIHCSHVVEHLEPQLFYDSLKEMDRCLAPGGYLVISTPLLWDGFYNDLSHVRPYNPKTFRNYLADKVGHKARTRSVISTDYTVTKLQYRYLPYDAFEDFQDKGNNILVKLFLFNARLLKKMGLTEYRKTGYTIVLQKSL